MDSITLTRPDDWHLHLRDGAEMGSVIYDTARRFGRGLIMPNLKPPVTNVEIALAYRQRIISALPAGSEFCPYMTIYLTDETSPEMIREAATSEYVLAAKLYPANVTTNSAAGVTNIERLEEVFGVMEESGLVLCVHGELLCDVGGEVDPFDREKRFLEEILLLIVDGFPKLKIVLEHITTEDAVQFIEGSRENVVATITAHHLLDDRRALFRGGVNPHYYCLPILKRQGHREALLLAATSGSKKFFLGTDSAPHEKGAKESACGCAGCYTAGAGIELYAEAFEEVDALHRLEGFASFWGADFYGLKRNTDTIILNRDPWVITAERVFGQGKVVPYRAGQVVHWQLFG